MVEAMLDLVKDQANRIDSRFLEPACGSGNFLARTMTSGTGLCHRFYTQQDLV
jgi:23S rRNA G2445 N2-methylase RlmL